jgi:hypothetical protein
LLQNTIDVDVDFIRRNSCHLGLHLIGGVQSSILHCNLIVLLSITVQNALVTGFVFAERHLAKVLVTGNLLAAKVAHQCATPAADLVASVGFDKRLLALGTGPDLSRGDRFLNGSSSFRFNGILRNLLATATSIARGCHGTKVEYRCVR